MFQVLLLFAFVIPAILFLISQQRTLSAVQPENRLMQPGLVWLQVIPFFGQVWQFFVVSKISGSIAREFGSEKEDSIIGISHEAIEGMSERPTYKIGMAYCILISLEIIFNYVTMPKNYSPFTDNYYIMVRAIIILLLFLSGMVCWIIYWVALGKYLRILRRKSLQLS